MSTFDYASVATRAAKIIERFGIALTFTRTVAGGAMTTQEGRGVFAERVRHVLGDSGVQIGDWKILADNAATPVEGMRVSANGESFVVVHVEPIKPGGVVVAQWVYARGG